MLVSDGVPRRWREHAQDLVAAGRLDSGTRLKALGGDGTRVRNGALRALLGPHRFMRLTPLAGPEVADAWRVLQQSLDGMARAADAAGALRVALEAATRITASIQRRRNKPPVTTWNEVAAAWVESGIALPSQQCGLARLGGIPQEDAVEISRAAQEAPTLLGALSRVGA